MAYAASQPIMTHPAASPPHRPHLDRFLHADVGQERNGMDLSVLSVLARLDKDPWEEAARLAGLPPAAAVASLAGAIASMPDGAWPLTEAQTIALRLIPLLQPERPEARRGGGVPSIGRSLDDRRLAALLIIIAFGALLTLATCLGVGLLRVITHTGQPSAPAATSANGPPL